MDLETGHQTKHVYPKSQIPEEHLWVPAPGGSGLHGWVIVTVHDWQQQCTVLNVFAGQAIDDGPVASATLPYALPLGFHGKFVSA